MGLHTVVCDVLGIDVPVVLAGMGGAANPKLAHYWRLGADPNAVGFDYSLVGPLDLDEPAGNVDAEDIVEDAPASLVTMPTDPTAAQ